MTLACVVAACAVPARAQSPQAPQLSSIRVSAEAARGATGACAKAEARDGAGTLEATANVTLSVEVSPAAR